MDKFVQIADYSGRDRNRKIRPLEIEITDAVSPLRVGLVYTKQIDMDMLSAFCFFTNYILRGQCTFLTSNFPLVGRRTSEAVIQELRSANYDVIQQCDLKPTVGHKKDRYLEGHLYYAHMHAILQSDFVLFMYHNSTKCLYKKFADKVDTPHHRFICKPAPADKRYARGGVKKYALRELRYKLMHACNVKRERLENGEYYIREIPTGLAEY